LLLLATGKDSDEQLGGLNSLFDLVANTLRLGSLSAVALHAEFRQKLLDLIDQLRVLVREAMAYKCCCFANGESNLLENVWRHHRRRLTARHRSIIYTR